MPVAPCHILLYCFCFIQVLVDSALLEETSKELGVSSQTYPLSTVRPDGEEASGLCIFQVKRSSVHLQSVPTPESFAEGHEVNTSTKENRHVTNSTQPYREVSRPSLSLLSVWRSRSRGFAGWISFFVVFCCLCLCGSAIGEHVLHKLYEYYVIVEKVEEALIADDKQDASERSNSPREGASASASETSEENKGPALYEEYLTEYWDHYSGQDEPDIFGHDNMRIMKDGGMKDVPRLKLKYTKALFVLGVGFMNCILILATDFAALNHIGPSMKYGQDFLITKFLEKMLLSATEEKYVLYMLDYDINKMVPLLELSFVIVLVFSGVCCLVGAIAAPYLSTTGHGELHRWTCVSTFFWYIVPQLTSCSALRLLHYVTPAVITSDGYVVGLQAWQVVMGAHSASSRGIRHYAHAIFSIVFFALSRTFALVLGCDVFLVKFRLASSAVDGGRTDIFAKLAAFAFLWQVIGIIQLKWFMEKRLFIFIFAGKDGSVDIDEEALIDVWKALLSKKVFSHFGFFKGIVIMFGFDTYDLQFLVLDDDEDKIRATTSVGYMHGSTPVPTGIREMRQHTMRQAQLKRRPEA